jgi:hypothetical protein
MVSSAVGSPSYWWSKVFQGFKVVFGPQQFLAFDAQRSGDEQGFVGDLLVQVQQLVQLAGGQKVPVLHGATDGFDIGVVLDELLLGLGVHAPVHPANALHQTHGVPVQVVVDEARGVLQVQAFTEHVGGDQHAGFRLVLVGQGLAGHAVVVRGKLADHVAAAALGGGVDLVDAFDAGLFQLRPGSGPWP